MNNENEKADVGGGAPAESVEAPVAGHPEARTGRVFSGEQFHDEQRRESFYEAEHGVLTAHLARISNDLSTTRVGLRHALEALANKDFQIEHWRALAMQFGIETTAEKRKREHALHGTLVINSELIICDGVIAIDSACARLAQHLRKEAGLQPPASFSGESE